MLPLSLTKRVGFSLVIYKRDRILLVVICDFFIKDANLATPEMDLNYFITVCYL